MLNYVHSSFICNIQKLKTTYMSLNWRTDKENVIHLHMEYYSAIKNENMINFVEKWMELKNILSEIIWSQKGMHGV